ncbi:MAG TPA: hypothetical protein VGR71_08780, partial [Nitrospira sp.]|nr:hypothetical protein [Nitrospira sp.]
MAGEYKLVDAFVGLPQRPREQKQPPPMDPNIAKWFKPGKAFSQGTTIEDVIEEMDTAGVEKGVLTAGALQLHRSPYQVGQNIPDELYDTLCRKTTK